MSPLDAYALIAFWATPALLLTTTVLTAVTAILWHQHDRLPVIELAPGCADMNCCRGLLTGDTHDRSDSRA